MSYSQFYLKKEAKIPTIVSFLVVALILILMGKFFFSVSFPSTASKKQLHRMEIANIFSNQTTIVWQTDQKETGWVVYGTDKNQLNQTASDDRDLDKNKNSFLLHYVTLQNLKENTQYFFKIVSNSGLIEKPNRDAFGFKTPSSKLAVRNLSPAYGKVINQLNQPVENTLVLLYINHAYTLAGLSKSSGEWLIPLNYIIDSSTQEIKNIGKDEAVRLQFLSEEGPPSNIKAVVSNLSPVTENVVIGKDYDFTKPSDVLSADSQRITASIEIVFPKENATIPTGNPLIKGKAVPNSTVSVTVSEGKSATSVQAGVDKDGVWQVTLPQQLAVGQHTITLQAKDQSGNILTKTRLFTVAKSGERVLGEATGSATPTITPAPTTTTQPITSVTPTTLTATVTPKPPVTGENITYLGLTSGALILLGLGILVVF